ncbi:PREDICTED: odorant receptor 43a-like [Vollenhovia emeryi]|uniref:odorant receptor 43a-like n=1 Tax=Vollenhovia emeryi TaxID=411798 RepID=UPI0005F44482|nr:PREDICTED: odorant receptor 43a-like [Vollenhovia emeryi]XP_011867930.1 PREDICTED: odorant receptor 43a-like [Vollenhovia emeryi]
MISEEVNSAVTTDMIISTHSGYKDYNWVIKLNRPCLRLFGVWPEPSKTPRKKLMMDARVIIISNIIIWSSIIPTLHSFIRIWGNITSMIDNLQYSLPLLISIIKLVLLWQKKQVLIPVLQMVKEDWIKSKSENERVVMLRQARKARLIMIWGYFIMLVSFICIVILPTFNISMRYMTNITDPGKVLPLQTYYIYNVNDSPFYETTFILQGFSLMTAGAIYTGTDSFMGYLVFHVCGQLENLKTRILNLDKFSHFEEALSSSVQDHKRLIRSIKIIDNTFNLMLLGLLVYFGILFALFGFLFITIMRQGSNLSIGRLICILTTFINTFTHMCLYCVVGEFLVVQCDGIYEATYHYKWYNLKPKQARNLLVIMMLANKPLHLTAGKLFPMTMATFCNLLKTSGGYISVLVAQ